MSPDLPPDKPKWTDLFGIDPGYLEGVPEEPTLTAAEVKVLTEAALRLGRKEALEEMVERCERRTNEIAASSRGLPMGDEWWTMTGLARGWDLAGKLALDLASRSTPDATSARTEAIGYSDLPQDSKAGREAL